MKKLIIRSLLSAATLFTGGLVSSVSLAAVPSPTVNQKQGMPDTVYLSMTADVCRICHNQNPPTPDPTYLGDRHHMIVNQSVDVCSCRPNPDVDSDGVPDIEYQCLSCHSIIWGVTTATYRLDRSMDCLDCHNQSEWPITLHHLTTSVANQDCKACHGGFINNPDDGHDIPTYDPSRATPWPSGKHNGDGSQVSSAGTHPGNCDFCHNTLDGEPGAQSLNPELTWFDTTVYIYTNTETHHSTGIFISDPCNGSPVSCFLCHDDGSVNPPEYAIRTCETCHGVSTLHNVAWDSDSDGAVKPGVEPFGYGHTGAPDDCWGCHGYNAEPLAISLLAPGGGPIIPNLASISNSAITGGSDTTLILGGANFTNYVRNPWTGEYDFQVESVVELTGDADNTMQFIPDTITENSIEVVIPASVAPGNYRIVVKKGPSESNPMNLTVTPPVIINTLACKKKILTIIGSGFGEYLDVADSGTGLEAPGLIRILSWSDTMITAEVSKCGNLSGVVVHTIYD